MRTNIVLDEPLVTEAFKYTTAKTKRELVRQALEELVANHKRRDLLDLFGAGGVSEGYDHRALRQRTP